MQLPFKKGLFLHITSHDKNKWAEDIKYLNNFPSLDFIEIWLEEIDLSVAEITWLKQRLSQNEIIIHAPFINLSLVSLHQSINAATVALLKRTIDISKQLSAKIVTTHGGAFPIFLDQSTVRKTFIKNFKQLIDHTENKVILTIENISFNKTTQISYPVLLNELSAIQSSIPSINFTLDVGHCIQNNDDFTNFLVKNMACIKNIHLHNAIKNGKAHFGFNKNGDLQLRQFVELLKDINYSNYLSLEVLNKQDLKESWKALLKQA